MILTTQSVFGEFVNKPAQNAFPCTWFEWTLLHSWVSAMGRVIWDWTGLRRVVGS